ncbi:MAG: transglutaminase [Psychromonas sp.]|nr:transglutaminase [Alteromonadales bacterium]MCP5078959.1 transglutaminase [Psychromonas sp.]
MLFLLSSDLFSQDSAKLLELFTPQLKEQFSATYGKQSRELLEQWLTLISDNESEDDWKRIHVANHFFNKKVSFVDDIIHWKKKDYWATPVEFIGTQGGDCEDFALAKYFTLKAMGVDPQKMRLMYVRALAVNQAHMVLIYSEKLEDIPLVLDNINHKILPANKRRDLKPIYSFNGDGLWLAKAKGLGKQIKGKGDVSRWEDIVTRIERSQFNTN